MLKNVYFVNTKELVSLINDGKLTGSLALKYLTMLLILTGGGVVVPIEFKPIIASEYLHDLAISLLSIIFSGVLTYFGLKKAFEINAAKGGNQFFERLASFALPVCVQLTLIYLFVGFAAFSMMPSSSTDKYSELVFSVIYLVLDASYVYFFYAIICKLFSKLNNFV